MTVIHPRSYSHRFLCLTLAALMAAGPTASRAVGQAADPVAPLEVDSSIGPPTLDPSSSHGEAAIDLKTLTDLADFGDVTDAAQVSAPIDRGVQPLQVDFAVANTCVLVALRPAQFLNSPMAEFYPTEVLQAAGLKHVGLDPLTAESVVFSLAPTIGGPPSYSLFARFNKPCELRSSELTAHAAPAEVAGRNYLQSKDPMLPSIIMLDEHSLLVAPDYFLRNLVSSPKTASVGSFPAAFAAADRGDDLLAMIDVAPLRTLINMGASQADIPPELTSAKELPNLVRFIELRANFSRAAESSLRITANNEADAKKVVTIFNEIKQHLTAKWAIEAQKQLASEDPVEQAGGRYSLRMSRLVDERLQLQQEQDQLVIFRGNLTGQGGNPMISIATIGVLVGLLVPAVQAAREAARRTQSMNNMKNIILAMLMYHDAHKAFPPYANRDSEGKALLSWRVHILPYLEQQGLYDEFHLDEPWDSEHNKQLISRMPAFYLDPSSGMKADDGKTHYQAVMGAEYIFNASGPGRSLRDISDGTSNTIAVVQTGNASVVTWTKPDDWQPDEKNLMKPFDPLHPDGFIAGLADGSVSLIEYNIDPKVLKALLTIAGDEAIPPTAK